MSIENVYSFKSISPCDLQLVLVDKLHRQLSVAYNSMIFLSIIMEHRKRFIVNDTGKYNYIFEMNNIEEAYLKTKDGELLLHINHQNIASLSESY